MRRVRYVRCRATSMAALLPPATPPRTARPAAGGEPRQPPARTRRDFPRTRPSPDDQGSAGWETARGRAGPPATTLTAYFAKNSISAIATSAREDDPWYAESMVKRTFSMSVPWTAKVCCPCESTSLSVWLVVVPSAAVMVMVSVWGLDCAVNVSCATPAPTRKIELNATE